MKATLEAVGDGSMLLVLPAELAVYLGWGDGDEVSIDASFQEDEVILSKRYASGFTLPDRGERKHGA